MGLETGTYIDDLVAANPTSTDLVKFGDDHIRLIKSVLLATFPNIDGAVNPTVAQLNYLVGVTSLIQDQLDARLAAATADGDGLTEAAGVLAVGAGSGIAVAADAVAVDLTSLAQADMTDLDAGSEFLVNDAGTNKAVRIQDFGVPQTTDGTTTPLSAADLTYANRIFNCNNASAISAVIPAAASVDYPLGTVLGFTQIGVGQVTVSVTSDTLNAPNGAKTRARYSTIYARKWTATVWIMSGDTAV